MHSLHFIPFKHTRMSKEKMVEESRLFYEKMNTRRSIRSFSDQKVPTIVIENIIRTASSAPSGAHKQPWTFCAISSPEIKTQIRVAAEEEEKKNYAGRMPDEWLEDLEPFGTDWQKPFLETAPWLIAVFKKSYDLLPDASRKKNYYVTESVGLATGFLLAAIHHAGLVALTHTPSPMQFLEQILNRPTNEKAFLLIPVGYPASDAQVPDLNRKNLSEVSVFY